MHHSVKFSYNNLKTFLQCLVVILQFFDKSKLLDLGPIGQVG